MTIKSLNSGGSGEDLQFELDPIYVQEKAETERSTLSTTLVKVKEITITSLPQGQTEPFSLSFTIEYHGTGGLRGYARIYRNDGAVGSETYTNSTSYVWVTHANIAGWSKGDKIQLYIRAQSTGTAYARGFRVAARVDPQVGSFFTVDVS